MHVKPGRLAPRVCAFCILCLDAVAVITPGQSTPAGDEGIVAMDGGVRLKVSVFHHRRIAGRAPRLEGGCT